MLRILFGRARRGERARLRSFIASLAGSWILDNLTRFIVMLVIVLGMLMTTWGLMGEVNGFSTDLSTLVQFAGGGDAVFSSTIGLFQSDILGWLGLGSPDTANSEGAPVPDTGVSFTPTPSPEPTLPQGAGFVPIQVEVTGKTEEAPTLPAVDLPGTATPTIQNTPVPANPTQSTQGTPVPTATPLSPAAPGWIVIPKIGLDAPVVVSHTKMVVVDGQTFAQWEAPNLFAAGWQEGSAMLGEPGNTVLNGHHNIYGRVFGRLVDLNQGDQITVYSGDRAFNYLVSQVMKIEERDASLQQRQENARWVMPSTDERLTLVTCWPPSTNTYRLIVVAVPVK